ncbi:SUN protein [Amylolactobacillus amylotrophicus DSM 20534]|uniref:16S rRNA (cytosine(967)-C(5))-methyltransferase n=3 Tax=Amylolactobacillus TaxID=2767876 RepID=A0A0R1YLA4_9LACO|nr:MULTISPECIES: 16S rRNA (cytosine(967)-C(5))-methyltransferase RsmB [Amylolactobacillus]APT17926.1 16S rRNA (cytosine(967)-C(5))-methyltransferase [Amylolactobacillus amylophilus DSM 20533 = JCM 1125]KRK38364.1 SUN protein [Amylolactobacillus amylotrophicus DSM 20534]KRM42993.1 SUN protein [Amylolactobacillus amylophilus DSM 20533 = JCM 1125]GED79862.1 ribosomal RNA small subunit methyltransferase B [Amylolactobacillus amylophilus]
MNNLNVATAREVALNVLTKVLQQKSYSNIQLNFSLNNSTLDERDKALVTQLVYGTIQYKLFLEYQIKHLLRAKPKESFVVPLLLMSVYQLQFLDKIPDHAVLNSANELAKKRSSHGAYKLVNGILRNVQRQGPLLPAVGQTAEYLSIKESMPEWLVKYLSDKFGNSKTARILQSLNTVSHNSVRVNTKKTTVQAAKEELHDQGFDVTVSPLRGENILLSHGGVAATNLFRDGQITIQDEASSVVVDALHVEPGDIVLDACAAPGGKTMQIAELLDQNVGKVTALDLHEKKLALIENNAKRLELTDLITVQAMDARNVASEFGPQKFDKILVDAPCSGLGLLRRKPEIRYEKTFTDIINLSKIQLAILESVAQSLKIGGRIVYSTCTITPEENEEVVARFIAAHPEFFVEQIKLPSFDSVKTEVGTDLTVRIFPDDYQTDGFSITSLRLRG